MNDVSSKHQRNESNMKKYLRKPHFCIFCKVEIGRINQHFLRKHKDEERVRKILSIEDKRKRLWAWKCLTQEGDFFFNENVEKGGEKKTVKKANKSTSRKIYFYCPRCLGRIKTTSKALHTNVCRSNVNKDVSSENQKLPPDIYGKISESVINKLRNSQPIRNFIQSQKGVRNRASLRTMISDLLSMEEYLKQLKGGGSLANYMTPSHVDDFVKVLTSLASEVRFQNEKIFSHPTRVQRLMQVVKKFGRHLTLVYKQESIEDKVEEVNTFIKMFHAGTKEIRKEVRRSVRINRLQNNVDPPKKKDLTEFVKHLEAETPVLVEKLRTKPGEKTWRNLAGNLLCRLIIFNRQGGTVVENLTVEDFLSRRLMGENVAEGEVFNSKQELGKTLENFKVIETVRKHQNTATIIISSEVEEAMCVLMEYRKHANIHPKNEHFFAATKKSVNSLKVVRVVEKFGEILSEDVRKSFMPSNLEKERPSEASAKHPKSTPVT